MLNKACRVVIMVLVALFIGINLADCNRAMADSTAESQSFALAISSDPQYPWYDGILPKGLTSDADKNKNSERQITEQYQDMNALALERANSKFRIVGCIINGDLTAFGHDDQYDKYMKMYQLLKIQQYPGLGNHDYANNVDDSYENNCAIRMVKFMYNWLKSFPVKTGFNLNYDFSDTKYYKAPSLRTDYTGSLAYSFNLGTVHIVQLQNYPSYERKWNGWNDGEARRDYVYIKKSFDWLKNDLATARNRGDIILVNLHDYGNHFSGDDKNTFDNIAIQYGVSAVFAGHIHGDCGKISQIPGSAIPIFRSGASSYQDYLVADIDCPGKVMTVRKRACGENAPYYSFDEPNVWTVTLNATKPSPPLPVPPKTGFVTFYNDGGFVAKFELHYTVNGEEKIEKTGNMSLGNKKTYDIPADATNIRVVGAENTGIKWKEVFDKTYDCAPNATFKLYGTTLNPKWKTE